MNFIKPPKLVKNFYKNFVWDIPVDTKKVFLTFDDCSDKCLTYWVMDVLAEYDIKATFFCTGKYIEYDNLHKVILENGHNVGNHGFEHLNGFKTSASDYVQNALQNYNLIDSNLFRPPYGKITAKQAKLLSKNFKIVMWSILTYDFDEQTTPAECLRNVTENVYPGAIIVFHTNRKATRNLHYALPASIEYLLKNGYEFGIIE